MWAVDVIPEPVPAPAGDPPRIPDAVSEVPRTGRPRSRKPVSVDTNTVLQLVTLLIAVLSLVWHQQHTTDKLRDEVRQDITQLRGEVTQANAGLREEVTRDIEALQDSVADIGQRLARIEGLLAAAMPEQAALLLPVPDTASPG